jgi:exoribonuclease R
LKWLEAQPAQSWAGTIVHLNANGLIVQLDDNGAIGFVDLKKKKDEYSYDPLRMMLKFEDHHYQLDQKLSVTIRKTDGDNLLLAFAN